MEYRCREPLTKLILTGEPTRFPAGDGNYLTRMTQRMLNEELAELENSSADPHNDFFSHDTRPLEIVLRWTL